VTWSSARQAATRPDHTAVDDHQDQAVRLSEDQPHRGSVSSSIPSRDSRADRRFSIALPGCSRDIMLVVRGTSFANARHCNTGPGRLRASMSVDLFRNDDRGYTAWLTQNDRAYALHLQRSTKAAWRVREQAPRRSWADRSRQGSRSRRRRGRQTPAYMRPLADRSPARRRAAGHGPGPMSRRARPR
jgi:hypothetical protein